MAEALYFLSVVGVSQSRGECPSPSCAGKCFSLLCVQSTGVPGANRWPRPGGGGVPCCDQRAGGPPRCRVLRAYLEEAPPLRPVTCT